ncbi:hypothetical protein BVRB_011340 [Beta vulgaris subsp. vulgaris]|uniref:Cytochrome P450 n=2 Tax=Beta vulgaris subsp. vulgaris TaxID=3555 RepID=A0A0J8B2I7_BETVV|nr:hypothetical protein BVRB_011340 [Beta vulgaris subsp. vulgaris]
MQSLITYFLPFLLFLFFLHKWVSTKSIKKQNLPPSPPKLPIIGHIHMLGMLPHRTLRSLSDQYGELMLLYFGSKPTLIVSSARVAKEVMKTHDAVIANRFEFIINGKLFYNYRDVVTSSYGEYWRQMKSIFVLQLLSNKRVRSFKNIREEETALLMKKISQKNNNNTNNSNNNNNNNNKKKNDNDNDNGAIVNLSEMFMVLTNDLICRVSFGRKYGEDKKSGVDFNVIKEFVELLGVVNIGDFIPWLGWMNRFNGLNAKVERVAERFDLLLEDIITEHLNRLDQARDFDNYEAKDFVDVLLKAQREKSVGFTLERENIKAMILD